MSKYLESMDEEDIRRFRRLLLNWYDQNKRPLPWRETQDPYKIWISEIMSQQTQVATVIPYYERFIRELPTIQDLAQVEDRQLMELWQGLGYYSRARNLKIAANQIVDDFDGQMPTTMKQLLTLRGIGPYTAAAIGSMAFGLVEPALDGNLFRVTARLFEIDADISKQKNRKIFVDVLYQLIDPERPGDFNQALMDLGATIMTPANSRPEDSPLVDYDLSYRNQTVEDYPVKKSRTRQTTHSLLAYFVYREDGKWLMRKHGSDELLSDLWHLPLIEKDLVIEAATASELLEPLEEWLTASFDQVAIDSLELARPGILTLDVDPGAHLPTQIRHIFSHRIWNVQIIPVKFQGQLDLEDSQAAADNYWHSHADFDRLPISTLQSKLFAEIFQFEEE